MNKNILFLQLKYNYYLGEWAVSPYLLLMASKPNPGRKPINISELFCQI